MTPTRFLLFITVLFAGLSAVRPATAATITYEWMTAEVTITHPDAVIYGQPFDISFSVDTSTADEGITLTFETYVDISDTVDIADCTWEYLFFSIDPPWNLAFYGQLGDATTPTTHGPSGYLSRLYDPVNGQYTWLWSDYDDRVVWTLRDLVLYEDTSFDWRIKRFLAGSVTFTVDVPLASVPALPPLALFAAWLGVLAAGRRSLVRR